MILNDTNISCRDVLRGLWFSTKFSCDFSIFFCAHSVLHTKISTENSCICRGVLHSRQIGKSASREYSEAGGAWGRRLHSARLYCCEKAHRSLPRCAAAFLCCLSCFLRQVFHNPALALFFADFSQRRNPLRFGKLRLLFGTFPAQRYHFVRAVSSI